MRAHRTGFIAPLTLVALGVGSTAAAALPTGWEAPSPLSAPSVLALEPWTAANAKGDLVVAWRAREAGREVVQLATRPAGAAAWGAPVTFGPRVPSVRGVRVTIDDTGRILVGWRTKNGPRVFARAALIESAGAAPRVSRLGRAREGTSAVNVALSAGGQAVVVWSSKGPVTVRRTPGVGREVLGGHGRATVSIARPGEAFGPARLFGPRRRPLEGGCAIDYGVDVAPGANGRVLAWWECSDAIRDSSTAFSLIGPSGRIGRVEQIANESRGDPTAAIVDTGTAILGLSTVDDEDDAQHLRLLSRSAGGRWTVSPVPVNEPNDELRLPYVSGHPRLASAPGGAVFGAWVGLSGSVGAASGPGTGGPLAPAVTIAPAGEASSLAGAGISAADSMLTAWAVPTVVGEPESTVLSITRLAGDATFPAAVDSFRIPELMGTPSLAMGLGGRGAIAYSQGPLAAARVHAAAIVVP